MNKYRRYVGVALCLMGVCITGYEDAVCARQGDLEAQSGYSELKEGKLASAETIFRTMTASSHPDVAIQGKEGLAETFWRQGKIEQASEIASEVIQKATKRAMAHFVKAKVLYKSGNTRATQDELDRAEHATSDFRWQKGEIYHAKGNLLRKQGQSKRAIDAYQQALQEDPDNLGALSNLGVTLQDLGELDKAIKVFSQLKQRRPADRLADALLRQAKALLDQKQDLEKQRYIDTLVKDLVQRYREQSAQEKAADDWTSPAIAISILGFQDRSEDLMERAGLDNILQEELTQRLQAANIKVVERAILDKLLTELKLGSSELADPDAALKLGKVLAARLVATGSLLTSGTQQSLVNFRLIDTETTNIVLPLSERQQGPIDPSTVADKFSQAIAGAVKDKYPVKGRIALAEGGTVIINLGKKHNITPGMVFNVLGEKEQPIELNGRILGYRQSKAGSLEVERVEDLMSYARPIEKTGEWKKNQKVIQKQ